MDPSLHSEFICKEEDEDGLQTTAKDQLKSTDDSYSSSIAEDSEFAFISVKEEPIDDVGTQNWSVDVTSDGSCSGVKEEPHCQETTVTDPLRTVTIKCRKDSGSGADMILQRNSVATKSLHKCPECGVGFYSLDQLDNHMENHWKEKPYLCDYCWKPFTQKYLRDCHKKIHTEERYICEKCGKSFKSKRFFNCHMQKHNGDAHFVCSYCGKKFTKNSLLNSHINIHTKELPFKCKKCGKAFPNEVRFNQHMRTHNREKLYACSHCGKSFSHTPYLAQHMRVHMSK